MDIMDIIKATNEEKKNWYGQTVNLWIQMEPEALLEIPESLLIRKERLNIFEGHKPRYFSSGELGHIRLECWRGEAVEERQEGIEKR